MDIQFDGLPGPTHNYSGMSHGNVASARHAGRASNPREAALQEVREAFAARAGRRFAWPVEPRRVEVLTDVVQGLYLGLLAFSAAALCVSNPS